MLRFESASLTDPGRRRDMNEDHVWAQVYEASEGEPVGLFIVCDGIGGHLGGENASQWAVETVKRELSDVFCPVDPRATVLLSHSELNGALRGTESTRMSSLRKLENKVRAAVRRANLVVYEYAKQKPETAENAGTTLTMGLIIGDRGVFANVGDSRAYLFRDGKLQQITQDHSLVATLVAAGQIKPEEVFTHPQRNLIYRSLGHKRDVQVDTFVLKIDAGDSLLFCSDGLWEMVRDEHQLSRLVLEPESVEEACRKLISAANSAGGEDNIGVIVVRTA